MTGQELIQRALRIATVIAPGETPTGDELQDGLTALNSMLSSWSVERLPVPVLTTENFTLVASTASYTIGSGATFNTARPIEIVNAYVKSNSTDYPIRIITQKQYNNKSTKTIEGIPYELYYNNASPSGTIYLYYTPQSADVLYIDSWKALTAVATLSTTLTFHDGYEEALAFNLAIRYGIEFGVEVSQSVQRLAMSSKRAITNLNTPESLVSLGLPATGARGLNIESGE